MLQRGGELEVPAVPRIAPAPAPIPEHERQLRAAAERRLPPKWKAFDQLVAAYSDADGEYRRRVHR